MKGIIFRAFIDHVETRFGMDCTDRMISSCDLSSGGAYTSVGTYEPGELAAMLEKLADLEGTDVSTLLKDFGRHLFSHLATSYPKVINHADSSFSLISTIDNHIHVEVQKLYPDSALPKFTCESLGPDQLLLTYRSERGLADLAEGLLWGCFDFFNERAELKREDLSGRACTHVRFTLRLLREPDG